MYNLIASVTVVIISKARKQTTNTLQMYIERKKRKAHFRIGKFNLAAFAQHRPALAEGLDEMSMFENVTESRDPKERGEREEIVASRSETANG